MEENDKFCKSRDKFYMEYRRFLHDIKQEHLCFCEIFTNMLPYFWEFTQFSLMDKLKTV